MLFPSATAERFLGTEGTARKTTAGESYWDARPSLACAEIQAEDGKCAGKLCVLSDNTPAAAGCHYQKRLLNGNGRTSRVMSMRRWLLPLANEQVASETCLKGSACDSQYPARGWLSVGAETSGFPKQSAGTVGIST